MISYVSGKIAEKNVRSVVVEVGGLGYEVFVTNDTLSQLRENAQTKLLTHHVVREDAQDLYGFLDADDLKLFQLLLSVPGIGPKTALNILSVATPETLRHSITSGETAYLTKISGIGKKTAEKIVLELKEKLGAGMEGATLKEEVDALEALKSLGYSHGEARDALKSVPKEAVSTSDRIKQALKLMGK